MNDERAFEYIKDKLHKKDKKMDEWLEKRALLRYIRALDKGDWSYYVPELEDKYIENKLNKIEKEEIIEMEKRILIRVTKDYQVVEVEVSNLANDYEYEQEKQWALQEARETLAQLPSSTTKTVSKDTYKKETKNNEQPRYTSGKVTIDNLTISQGSAKQKDFLVQGINKG